MKSNVTPLRGKNVLGETLQPCCHEPRTGFFRDGFCRTGEDDLGRHTVCAIMTQKFLDFSREQGNDLITPHPEFGFPGLKPGDKWCVCVDRWKEALAADAAPPVVLEACHASALEAVTLQDLTRHTVQ